MNISRETILQDALIMARHNLGCYSTNFSYKTPKVGHEEDHKREKATVEILEAWLKEFHSTCEE